MRFKIGKEYVFARVVFDRSDRLTFGPYLPWKDTLKSIDILKLTCTQHHKVPWDQDPEGEKKYDGFLFQETNKMNGIDGRVWENQFPCASYEQLDDRMDWIVKPYYVEADLNEERVDEIWSYMLQPYRLATHHLRDIHVALRYDPPIFDGKQMVEMHQYWTDFVSAVEKATRKQVEVRDLHLEHTDGTVEIVRGVPEVILAARR